MELIVARNPDAESSLPYLLRLPLGAGAFFEARDSWPHSSAVFCHQVDPSAWPATPDVIERIPLRECVRRGSAIDVVAERERDQRSQLVFTRSQGRQVVLWQAPPTHRQGPSASRLEAVGTEAITALEILVDSQEAFPYRFAGRKVGVRRKALSCGHYAVEDEDGLLASVERLSLPDLVTGLGTGRLGGSLDRLGGLPRAGVVVEAGYSKIFALDRVRPAVVADGVAALQALHPAVPIAFCDNRRFSEEWTYRFLAAAVVWSLAATEPLDKGDDDPPGDVLDGGPEEGGDEVIPAASLIGEARRRRP